MDNADYIWQWLWERIGNAYGVAGLMGNLMAESSLKANNLQNSFEKSLGMTDEEYTVAVDDGRYTEDEFIHDRAGYGLAQWTYWSRKRDLLAFAKETGRSIGDREMQLEFLLGEIGRDYRKVAETLIGAKSVKEASDAVILEYERPADTSVQNRERRAKIGEEIYGKYAGTSSVGCADTFPRGEGFSSAAAAVPLPLSGTDDGDAGTSSTAAAVPLPLSGTDDGDAGTSSTAAAVPLPSPGGGQGRAPDKPQGGRLLETTPSQDSGTPITTDDAHGLKLTIYQRYFYRSDCYKTSPTMVPSGVQVHSTGANNPWLKRYVQPDDGRIGVNPNGNDHNEPGGNVCANAYIGKQSDGTVAVYQALPWNKRCWLSGSGNNGNANRLGYIGYEICEDGLYNEAYFRAAMEQAILLTAYLCGKFGIDVENVRDHSELHGMGLASNHGDISHWLVRHDMNMDDFRRKVKEAMDVGVEAEYVDCDEVKVLYQAIVNNPDTWLNVRSGPGKGYSVVCQVKKGSTVDVLDDSNTDWWKIRQNGNAGYAMSEYLKPVGKPEEPETPGDDEKPELPEVKETLEKLEKMLRQAEDMRSQTECFMADLDQWIMDCRSCLLTYVDYK